MEILQGTRSQTPGTRETHAQSSTPSFAGNDKFDANSCTYTENGTESDPNSHTGFKARSQTGPLGPSSFSGTVHWPKSVEQENRVQWMGYKLGVAMDIADQILHNGW